MNIRNPASGASNVEKKISSIFLLEYCKIGKLKNWCGLLTSMPPRQARFDIQHAI
jgi:hypothetical protein